MTNKYIYTKSIIKETLTAWWRRKFKLGYIEMGAMFVIGLILSLTIRSDWSIILTVLSAVCLFLFQLKERQGISLEMARLNTIYGDRPIELVITLGDVIEMTMEHDRKEISYDKLEGLIETENLIILMIKGQMTISLKKDSFETGSCEECLEFIRQRIPKLQRKQRK